MGDGGHHFSLSRFLSVAVEEGDVDTAAFIVVLKFDDVGFVEEVGIEDEGSILAMRDDDGFGSALFEKLLNVVPVRIVVVFGKVPVVRSFFVPHDESPVFRVAVGFVRRDPKIDIHGNGVGMQVEPSQGTVVLEGPGLDLLMLLKDTRKLTA